MLGVYLISTVEKADKNEYKFGKHKGTVSELVSRYTTYLIKPIVYFYCVVNNNTIIENLVKKRYKKYRLCSDKGTRTEWFKLELTEFIKKITSIIQEHDCKEDIVDVGDSYEEKVSSIIIPFGEEINMDYTYEEIVTALNENKEFPCIGLFRLLNFDKNKKENHNVYRTSIGSSGPWTIYTKDGIEKINDIVHDQIINETKIFINLIIKKYDKENKLTGKDLLEKARQEIFYDDNGRQGFIHEIFVEKQKKFFREIPLLFYNKRQIAMTTMSKL